MRRRLWLFQIPIIVISALCVLILNQGLDGHLKNQIMREDIFQTLLNISNVFTDTKFKIRGSIKPKNSRIVIVEIDDPSVQAIGRWPWHRNAIAELIDKTFKAGAQVIGLDIVFSEPDVRVSDEMLDKLKKHKLEYLKNEIETDPILAQTIGRYSDHLVLGWTPQGTCKPAMDKSEICPLIEHANEIEYPKNFAKYSVQLQTPQLIPADKSPLLSSFDTLNNQDMFSEVSKHAGFFQAFQDPDGVIRRGPMLEMVQGKAYPSLALEMARLIKSENLGVEFSEDLRLKKLFFINSGQEISTSSQAFVQFNPRGLGYTFPYVSALDVFSIGERLQGDQIQASKNAAALLKDAYVFIGLSALGASDLRSFTFDKTVPGVEGHATSLDNILANDFISHEANWWIYLLQIIIGLLFVFCLQKLDSITALVLFLGTLITIAVFDYRLFLQNKDWNLCFLYIEFIIIYFQTLIISYIHSEKEKKFIQGAFSRYVSPDLVNSIIKNPDLLVLGGEKKNLTILFSDIRGFTSFSEKMEAQRLSTFLNEYLGIMTNIIFKNQGTLDKYIGDAIMAFWGAPLNIPKPATLACASAVQMMQALKENRQQYKKEYDANINIGIGINTGSVSVGNMGSATNFSYTAIGDHVNTASRLESLTKYYGVGILTSRFTFDEVMNEGSVLPAHRVLDFVKVKGKSKSIELIQILDQELSTQSIELFQNARKAYQEQNWLVAIDLFQQVDQLIQKQTGTDDVPCQLYILRCLEFKNKNPGINWDGSWEMQDK